ncbi:MAG: metal-dependent hydrolase [Candidatus Aminicenantes bacterium]|nr:metal-dependent hydrolase [Candidatus Aminicenantes bacterium]
MPLPVGHALAGIAAQQVRPGFFFRNRWLDAALFVLLSVLPDADFLPGLLRGRPNLYHHGAFHSIGAALAVAALAGGLFFLRTKRFWPPAAVSFLLFGFHLFLDYFSLDLVAPFGLPLLWPFSGRYFISARPFFSNITRSARSGDFFPSLFNRHNLEAAMQEIVILGGLLAAVVALRLLLGKRSPGE